MDSLPQADVSAQPFPVVGIGASAGGLAALEGFFTHLPAQTEMAFVVVQHLDPAHESILAEILARFTPMPVVQAEQGQRVSPGHVYVIPPNRALTIDSGKLCLGPHGPPHHLRAPIDVFFHSLAQERQEYAIGIILSGSGSDGVQGLKSIKAVGGMIMVQMPSTAQFDSMPANAVASGTADFVLTAEEMPAALLNYVRHYYAFDEHGAAAYQDGNGFALNRVLAVLEAQTRRDYKIYKTGTLVRRISRHMGLHQCRTIREYEMLLRKSPEAVAALAQDLQIGVTSFFREAETWAVLEREVLPELVRRLPASAALRAWVVGCASGEEAYTLGMVLLEALEAANSKAEIQIFATDTDERALETARQGCYAELIANEINAARLQRFFTHQDGAYKVSKKLRNTVIFSTQNVVADPPFSKIDLISCRNLLIYLTPEVQRKLVTLFHFALSEDGHLVLGTSESIGQCSDLFEVVSKKWRIYRKIGPVRVAQMEFPIAPLHAPALAAIPAPGPRHKAGIGTLAQQILLREFVPATVLINCKHQMIYLFGPMALYLDYPSGEPTSDLFLVLRKGLISQIRSAVKRAIRGPQAVRVENAQVLREGHYQSVSVTVTPVMDESSEFKGLLLISFRDNAGKESEVPVLAGEVEDDPLARQLEYELKTTREELQSTIEELETTNEEMQASKEEVMSVNEELQASNEELQSSNEELKTTKEELQSLNEELQTVNSELENKLEALSEANETLNNLINSTQIATVFLDTRLKIRRFTPAIISLFSLIPGDVGRPLADIRRRVDDEKLLHDAEHVLDTLQPAERTVRGDNGHWYRRRILPYRTEDNRVQGLVLLFDDMDEFKPQHPSPHQEEQHLLRALKAGKIVMYSHAHDAAEIRYSERWAEILGWRAPDLPPAAEFMAWLEQRAYPRQWQLMLQSYQDFLLGKSEEYEVEVQLRHRDGEWHWIRCVAAAAERAQDGWVTREVGVLSDVSQ